MGDKTFSDYFEIKILKAYQKPFTMLVEEGAYISRHKGELLNSKNEWQQAKIIRTTTSVVQVVLMTTTTRRTRSTARRRWSRRATTPGRSSTSEALGTVENFFKSKSLCRSSRTKNVYGATCFPVEVTRASSRNSFLK